MKKREALREKEKQKRTSTCAMNFLRRCCDVWPHRRVKVAVFGALHGLPRFQSWFSTLSLLGPVACPGSIRNATCPRVCTRLLLPLVTNDQEQLLQPRPVAGQLQRWHGWSGAWQGCADSSAIAPRAQDHLQQMTIMTQRRFSKCVQNTRCRK